MITKKYRWILYFITVTIITTIAVQLYWNYKNYEKNIQQVGNEIQLSLDNAIEEYYAKLAKEDFTTIINIDNRNNQFKDTKLDSILKYTNGFKKIKSIINDSSNTKQKVNITSISLITDELNNTDSVFNSKNKEAIIDTDKTKNNHLGVTFFKRNQRLNDLQITKSLKPILFSFASNFIKYDELDSLIKNQLQKKKLVIDYTFNHLKKDTIFYASKNVKNYTDNTKVVISKSTFLRENEKFKLVYKNPNLEALKRSYLGIILSFILSLLIVSCLFYLLKIINQQKELATIKNDLISNITHEFKTPIATVSTAIEAIENFNVLDDKEKTKKYLSLSSVQLKKLNQMVEKLLETATLYSQQLFLKKENINVISLIEKLVAKHKLIANKKEIKFLPKTTSVNINVDVFHFENIISNLIDNALKYGGNNIEITISSSIKSIEITVTDNGNGINKQQQAKVFDQFYRIPQGNTHNVKGFGIGLYYCKNIIEKHGGTIQLYSKKNLTSFKITIPNG